METESRVTLLRRNQTLKLLQLQVRTDAFITAFIEK